MKEEREEGWNFVIFLEFYDEKMYILTFFV
jgi:hypothetical protein